MERPQIFDETINKKSTSRNKATIQYERGMLSQEDRVYIQSIADDAKYSKLPSGYNGGIIKKEFIDFEKEYPGLTFKKTDFLYDRMMNDARNVFPRNRELKIRVSTYFEEMIRTNLNNIYHFAPRFFTENFVQKTSINNAAFESYQVYIYLLCFIHWTDTHRDDTEVRDFDNIDQILNWIATRRDPSIEFIIHGPSSNSSITNNDFRAHYKTLIDASNDMSSIIAYNQLSSTQTISADVYKLIHVIQSMPNVYFKNPDEARKYNINIDSAQDVMVTIDSDNNLIFDCSYVNLGDVTEQNKLAKFDNLESVITNNKVQSMINTKKLAELFHNYSRIKILELVITPDAYISSLDAFTKVFVVFKGVSCSERNVYNTIPTNFLKIGGKFSKTNRGYEFKMDVDAITYKSVLADVKSFEIYLTLNPNHANQIIPNEYALSFPKHTVYQHPITTDVVYDSKVRGVRRIVTIREESNSSPYVDNEDHSINAVRKKVDLYPLLTGQAETVSRQKNLIVNGRFNPNNDSSNRVPRHARTNNPIIDSYLFHDETKTQQPKSFSNLLYSQVQCSNLNNKQSVIASIDKCISFARNSLTLITDEYISHFIQRAINILAVIRNSWNYNEHFDELSLILTTGSNIPDDVKSELADIVKKSSLNQEEQKELLTALYQPQPTLTSEQVNTILQIVELYYSAQKHELRYDPTEFVAFMNLVQSSTSFQISNYDDYVLKSDADIDKLNAFFTRISNNINDLILVPISFVSAYSILIQNYETLGSEYGESYKSIFSAMINDNTTSLTELSSLFSSFKQVYTTLYKLLDPNDPISNNEVDYTYRNVEVDTRTGTIEGKYFRVGDNNIVHFGYDTPDEDYLIYTDDENDLTLINLYTKYNDIIKPVVNGSFIYSELLGTLQNLSYPLFDYTGFQNVIRFDNKYNSNVDPNKSTILNTSQDQNDTFYTYYDKTYSLISTDMNNTVESVMDTITAKTPTSQGLNRRWTQTNTTYQNEILISFDDALFTESMSYFTIPIQIDRIEYDELSETDGKDSYTVENWIDGCISISMNATFIKAPDYVSQALTDNMIVEDEDVLEAKTPTTARQRRSNADNIEQLYYVVGKVDKLIGNDTLSKTYTPNGKLISKSTFTTPADPETGEKKVLNNVRLQLMEISDINKTINLESRTVRTKTITYKDIPAPDDIPDEDATHTYVAIDTNGNVIYEHLGTQKTTENITVDLTIKSDLWASIVEGELVCFTARLGKREQTVEVANSNGNGTTTTIIENTPASFYPHIGYHTVNASGEIEEYETYRENFWLIDNFVIEPSIDGETKEFTITDAFNNKSTITKYFNVEFLNNLGFSTVEELIQHITKESPYNLPGSDIFASQVQTQREQFIYTVNYVYDRLNAIISVITNIEKEGVATQSQETIDISLANKTVYRTFTTYTTQMLKNEKGEDYKKVEIDNFEVDLLRQSLNDNPSTSTLDNYHLCVSESFTDIMTASSNQYKSYAIDGIDVKNTYWNKTAFINSLMLCPTSSIQTDAIEPTYTELTKSIPLNGRTDRIIIYNYDNGFTRYTDRFLIEPDSITRYDDDDNPIRGSMLNLFVNQNRKVNCYLEVEDYLTNKQQTKTYYITDDEHKNYFYLNITTDNEVITNLDLYVVSEVLNNSIDYDEDNVETIQWTYLGNVVSAITSEQPVYIYYKDIGFQIIINYESQYSDFPLEKQILINSISISYTRYMTVHYAYSLETGKVSYALIDTVKYSNVPADYCDESDVLFSVLGQAGQIFKLSPMFKYYEKCIVSPRYVDEDGKYILLANKYNQNVMAKPVYLRSQYNLNNPTVNTIRDSDEVNYKIGNKLDPNKKHLLESVNKSMIMLGSVESEGTIAETAIRANQIYAIPTASKMLLSLEFS